MNTILLATCVSLILIALAWMAAKRDLTAAAARSNAPSLEELGELRETVERLIVVLESKAAEIEDRLQHHFDRIAHAANTRFPMADIGIDRDAVSQAARRGAHGCTLSSEGDEDKLL